MTVESKPNPDPTDATLAIRDIAVADLKEYTNLKMAVIVQRLDDGDEATKVLHETVTRVPTEMQLAVGHLKDVVLEKFESVNTRFGERDDRSKAEGVANEVKVNAAFAAQEKLAVQYNLASQASIDKSEKNTYELIRQNQETTKVALQSQADQISDLKDRLTKQESLDRGRKEGSDAWKYAIGLGISLTLLSITIVGFILAFKKT